MSNRQSAAAQFVQGLVPLELPRRVIRALFTIHVDSRCHNAGGSIVHDILLGLDGKGPQSACPWCQSAPAANTERENKP